MHSITLGAPVLNLTVRSSVCLMAYVEGDLIDVERDGAVFDILLPRLGSILLFIVVRKTRG